MASEEEPPKTLNGNASNENGSSGFESDEPTEVKKLIGQQDDEHDEITIKETVVQKTLTTEVTRRELTATCKAKRLSDESNKDSQGSQPPTPTPSSFGLDMCSTLPPLPPCLPPLSLSESKYRKTLQKLYTQLPERLHNLDGVVEHLFSKFIITESEFDVLRTMKKNDGRIVQCQKILDILRTKSDEEVEVWLNYLETEQNQGTVVNWIRMTASQIEEELLQQQQSTTMQRNPKKRSRHSSDSDDDMCDTKQPKLDLDLILRTVPPPSTLGASNKTIVKKQGHLLFSITFKEGIDDITSYLKQNLYRLKSELSEEIELPCSCITRDDRTEGMKSCASLVSVGFVSGEREAFELLESKLIDFESYVIQQKATLVSITEGCIRMKLRVNSLQNLDALYSDLSSGDMLNRITEWLYSQGYTGSDERPAFLLLVDDCQVDEVRECLQTRTTDRVKRRGVKHIKTLMESVESSTKNPKHDLDLIIRTIPKSTSTSQDDLSGHSVSNGIKGTLVGRKGPVLMSLKCIKGTDEVTGYVKHSFYKMKSELTKSLNTPCACITEDLRTRTDETDSAVVSVGFEAGEKEAYKILQSNMDDFEDYVFKRTAAVISVIEGCIKVTIRISKKSHVKALYDDITSGELLGRIVEWLLAKGYQGSADRAALLLTVDENKIKELMNSFTTEGTGVVKVTGRKHHGMVCMYKNQESMNKVALVEEWQRCLHNQQISIMSPICCI